jgi:hypothetical protein
MATQAQIIANRCNAQKSTGPRTLEGKAVVSQNAVKHGLLARRHALISSDSQQEFDLYRDQIIDALAPANAIESMLAERIVSLSWRLKRAACFQNQAVDAMHVDHSCGSLADISRSMFPRSSDKSQADPAASAPDLIFGHVVIRDFRGASVLDQLLTYERRIEKSLYRAMFEFQKLRIIRSVQHPNGPDKQTELQLLLTRKPRH